jgi:SAM-dependent methyltransferase
MNMPVGGETRLTDDDLVALANDFFLLGALQTTVIRGATLEIFLTNLRSVLLHRASAGRSESSQIDDAVVGLFCALAQQCFLNEYVYAQSDAETRQADRLRQSLLERVSAGDEISPLLLAAVAAYCPLHSLPAATSLLRREWPQFAADLLQQQVRDPLEEAEDRRNIPALTPVDDDVSLRVLQQYDENPYPRWSIHPLAFLRGEPNGKGQAAGRNERRPREEILIAGCGTGEHSFDIAQKYPDARILAIDLSRTALAYAQRKSREQGLRNIEYAQADILKLATIGRAFDRIESVGVLHHLADPVAGWRILLSLLAPNGIMRVGLYSEAARRSIVEARAIIAERGYRATAADIRAFRQTIIRARDDPRWDTIIKTVDFYSMSGCRDMLFNVMEHRFTIPEIAAFLGEHGLSFLGFELDAEIIGTFQEQYPGDTALTSLDHWTDFEAAHPQTFRNMYQFSVGKNGQSPR